MLEDFAWAEEPVDPRPLRRLAVVSGSVLGAAVVLLVHEHRLGAAGLSGVGLFAVWLVVALAALLLVAAVSGMLGRQLGPRRRRFDADELRDRQAARARLMRGDDLPPELAGAASGVVDEAFARRRAPWFWVVLGAYWGSSAFVYRGHEFWVHLVIGVGYLGLAIVFLREQRRLLRGAQRLGIRPSRREPSRARRWLR